MTEESDDNYIMLLGFVKKSEHGGAANGVNNAPNTMGSLLIPPSFFNNCGELKLQIRIYKEPLRK